MRLALIIGVALVASDAAAQSVVATRIIPAGAVIVSEDLTLATNSYRGAPKDVAEVIGQEALRILYPGRPIMAVQIGAPAQVGRNEIVTLVYHTGALTISTEGRALDRAGQDDRVRVMNLSSRATVTGRVLGPGLVEVVR